MHLFSKAWMCLSSCFFTVRDLQPYVATGQTDHQSQLGGSNRLLVFCVSFVNLTITVMPMVMVKLDFTCPQGSEVSMSILVS